MKIFNLYRYEDESKVSGTGKVAQGCVFDNGKVVIAWLVQAKSLGIYDNLEEVEKIHGHNGKTKIDIIFDIPHPIRII